MMKNTILALMLSITLSSAMSLSECANLTTQLKDAQSKGQYSKVMDLGGMIFLGCDGSLTSAEMDTVLKIIDRAEKKLKE